MYASAALDLDGDGFLDLIIGGNEFDVKLKFGRYDSSQGAVLLGDGKGGFKYLNPAQSGLSLKGQIRAIKSSDDLIFIYLKDQGVNIFQRHLSKEISQ